MSGCGARFSLYRRLPVPLRVGMTFVIVCGAWVFFRAKTLAQAGTYLACMFGAGSTGLGSAALAPCLYARYHVGIFALAAFLVWHRPNSWAFSRRITFGRAGLVGALATLAVFFLWTQTENPFIYFQF